jgi:hypothetical protein
LCIFPFDPSRPPGIDITPLARFICNSNRSILTLDEGKVVVFIPEADRPNFFGQVEARIVEQNQGHVVVKSLWFVVVGMHNYPRWLKIQVFDYT